MNKKSQGYDNYVMCYNKVKKQDKNRFAKTKIKRLKRNSEKIIRN